MGKLTDKVTGRGKESLLVGYVDRAVKRHGKESAERVVKLREKHPGASTAQLAEHLTTEYRRLAVGAGAGVGAAAVAPGLGTVASLALSGAEALAFIEVSARYVLSLATLHGMDPGDDRGRRDLLLSVMMGKAGVSAAQAALGSRGEGWATQLGRTLPSSRVEGRDAGLARSFATRFALRKGAGMFGRAFPFGIGAVIGGIANNAAASTVIEGARAAFGRGVVDANV